jgi:hypothetical protein
MTQVTERKQNDAYLEKRKPLVAALLVLLVALGGRLELGANAT